MSALGPMVADRPAQPQYRAAQMRVVSAALGLFAERGVSGTSLQMIADAMGVTKAAVYYQFKTKEEIVLAVADVELAALEAAIEAAEAEGRSVRAREVLLEQIIDLAIERRRIVGLLQSDPVMVRFLAEHEPYRRVIDRLFAVLLGEDPSPEAYVPAAMLSGAIGGAVAHPRVAQLDDETLRSHLLYIARRLFDLPE
jgi:AcrR family transcriptional regulator